jgi:diguanylate cyclase (GGDEF)-like protein
MSSAALPPPHPYRVLLSRLVWPAAFLFVGVVSLVFATVIWTSDSANQSTAERQKHRLAAAIDHELQDLHENLHQVVVNRGVGALVSNGAAREALFAGLGRQAHRNFKFLGAFLVSANGDVLSGMVEGAPAGAAVWRQWSPLLHDVMAAARQGTRPAHGGHGASPEDADRGVRRFLSDGNAIYGAVAMAVRGTGAAPPGTAAMEPVTVAFVRLEEPALRHIAKLHAMQDLRMVHELPAQPRVGLPIMDGYGAVRAYLSWLPDRTGDLMRDRLLPLISFGLGLAALLFGCAVLYIRSLARSLALTEKRAENLLGRDPLSGLPNRLLFGERLDEELKRLSRSGRGFAVMFLDLDRFKDVNDTYGHQAGDELIKVAAKRLQGLLRSTDTLARFGGDEFAIIQTNVRMVEDAEVLARRILDTVTQPFEIADATVTVGVSIGVALAPEHAQDRDCLMRLADTALYEAKSEGRNRYRLFQRQMDETIRMRKVVEEELRHAITHDELVLHYQPVFSADGESIVALEALVRWPHLKQGTIAPTSFVSIAEERGLVIPLGEWVLRRACEDGKRWPHVRIAVNVSPIQFRHRDFVASVTRALEVTGFEASRLELELTEGVVVEDADAAEAAMMELRALGVNLALDDFGTGYSSLIYLRRFAFDKIKIDRSFLESMEATGESAILVHSIVHLGRALGLTVTAEGVETREQHRFLQALGCHQLQGYLFSKPVPAEEIDRMLGVRQDRAANVSAA